MVDEKQKRVTSKQEATQCKNKMHEPEWRSTCIVSEQSVDDTNVEQSEQTHGVE